MVWLHFFPGRPWRRGGKDVHFFILFRICIFPVLFVASFLRVDLLPWWWW
jgi:hypothetical protein